MTGRPPPRPTQPGGDPMGRARPRGPAPGQAGGPPSRQAGPPMMRPGGPQRPQGPGGQPPQLRTGAPSPRGPPPGSAWSNPPTLTPASGPPGRSAGPPGRSAGPPGRAAGPPVQQTGAPGRAGPPSRAQPPGAPGSSTAQPAALTQRPGSTGVAGVGRALYRAEHRGSMAPPGQASQDSAPLIGVANLTLGSRSSQGDAPGNGNGNGNGDNDDVAIGRGGARGSRVGGRDLVRELRTRDEKLVDKKGTSGIPFNCMANYFSIKQRPKWQLLQYRVDISPEEDRTFVRKKLVRQHQERLKKYIFDGTMLFSTDDFGETIELASKGDDDKFYQVIIRRVGEIPKDSQPYLQFFNIMLRKVMEDLKLEMVGRNYYDAKSAVTLKEWKLELWLGYVTSMRMHEDDVLLCCEVSTKIIRQDTVYDQLKNTVKGPGGQAMANKLLLGAIVMTRYNNNTYRIDDISWDKKPSDKFPKRDGTEISYMQYYKERYGLAIKDGNQPLIVSMPKKSDMRRGMEGPVYLVPELCFMTGLSDDQRANFKLMKSVGEYTRQPPPERLKSLQRFSQRITGTPSIAEEMLSWGLKIDSNLVRFKGRTLDPERIKQAEGRGELTYSMDNADWGNQFRNFKMRNGGPGCYKWILITSSRDEKEAQEFANALMKSAAGMGFQMRNPMAMITNDSRTAAFVEKVNEAADKHPQMIMTVIPNNKGDSYHAIKKILCVDKPVPSQVITGTLLKKGKGIMSVATKVAIQMAAKLGAEPWAVAVPMKDTMIIGYDSYHDSNQRGLAVGAVVSTFNQELTRFSSSCTMHRNNEELLSQMKVCVTNALRKYQSHNGFLPKRIVVYRDGVGDGQIPYVVDTEVSAIKNVFKENDITPQFAFIIVSKRINSRFFQVNNGGAPINPPSGSVVDDVVTLNTRFDFFLISQSVRQGSVNPTSYNVVVNETQLKPEHFQKLTYKLTHLYFNWPGTVRVPSVCQYAHKLAYLIGTSVHRRPNAALDELLYYL